MIKINSTANGFVVEGVDSPFYPYEGKLTFPTNEVVVETEEDTEMALFRSASNFDVLFSGLIEEITIDGQSVTKENIHEKFSAVANAAQGGGGEGGMTPEEKQELKDVRADVERALGEIAELDYDKAEKTDVYTKEEVDEKIAQGGGGDPHYVSDLSAANDGKKVEFTDLTKTTYTWNKSYEFNLLTIPQDYDENLVYTIIGEPTYEFTDETTYLSTTNSSLVVAYNKTEKQYSVWSNRGEWTELMQVYVNGEVAKSYDSNQVLYFKAGDKVAVHYWQWGSPSVKKLTEVIQFDMNEPLGQDEWMTGKSAFKAVGYVAVKGNLKLMVDNKEVTVNNNLKKLYDGNGKDLALYGGSAIPIATINGQSILGNYTDIKIEGGVTKDELDAKQDKLTAGEGITIEDNVISATGGAGGDEHYKSEVVEGARYDAPVMTMRNGYLVREVPNPQGAGNAPIEAVGATYEESKDLVLKKDKYNTTPTLYVNEMGGGMQYQVATWNSSEGCLVFNNEHFGNYYLSTTIWYVNGEVIKEAGSYNFISGKKIHVYDEWNKDGDKLRIVDPSRWFDSWNWDVMFGFVATTVQSLEPYEYITYYPIDSAMEVEYNGNKYHLNPKENFKTINNQSIIGTGNITVTDSSTQSYSSGTATSGTYYKINGSAINKWNTTTDHFNYDETYNTPYQNLNRVLVRKYAQKDFVDTLVSQSTTVFKMGADLTSAIPTYIDHVNTALVQGDYEGFITYDNSEEGANNSGVTAWLGRDGRILLQDLYISTNWYSYNFDVYVSDTKDGNYTKLEPSTVQFFNWSANNAVILEAGKWYKVVESTYKYGDYLFGGNGIQLGQRALDIFVLSKKWGDSDIDDALYYQHGLEWTPILTQKNISKYVDINGGGGADLSNYPTKQEVNQTYVQKQGEYVKNVTTNGGSINFAKGNGTDDVVNLKTIGGQSIIGMDNIALPTAQESGVGTKNNYIYKDTTSPSNRTFVLRNFSIEQGYEDSVNFLKYGWNDSTWSIESNKTLATPTTAGFMRGNDKAKLDALPTVWKGTQSEYDALGSHDDNTLYLITE